MQAVVQIENYLTEDQKREIAIDEWRRMCREACEGNAERIMANIAYKVVHQMIDESLGDGAAEKIKSKALEVIDEMSVFSVFREPDAWHRGASPAYKTLSDAVVNARPLVEKKVSELIHQLTKQEALSILKSGVIQINPGGK